jgi:DNA-directed RNA polymerase subunit omega
MALREIAAGKVSQQLLDEIEKAEKEKAEREALEWAAAEMVDDDLGKGGDDL